MTGSRLLPGDTNLLVAQSAGDIEEVRTLFREYAASLGIDLLFQGFDEELATLPGKYAQPLGVVFIARAKEGRALGCVGVRPLAGSRACEMKRLYVRPEGRGSGLGRAMACQAIGFAAARGYREMLLDTLPTLTAAIGLYRSLGFAEIAPYYHNPVPGVLYFRKLLAIS